MNHETQHIDWASIELPDAWPDRLNPYNPLTALRLLYKAMQPKRGKVQLPAASLPIAQDIPKYVLQEFHNLPNGNYSKNIANGYARWFDRVMLGTLRQGRAHAAQHFIKAQRVIDIGCGAGHMAAAIQAHSTAQVWGLDASPYLLQAAAQAHPDIHWRHGLAENTDLPAQFFDGVSLCFVLHEIPPLYLRQVLAELQRITKPNARIVIIEPSDVQWHGSYQALWREHGWRGAYFKWLANHAHEPFVQAWHEQNLSILFNEYGFNIESDERGCPLRVIVAVKTDAPLQAV